MIIIMKERHMDKLKEYYKTVCPKCGTRFAFSQDDMNGVHSDEYVKCPICDKNIPHYTSTTNLVCSNFVDISYRRYKAIMKKYCTTDKTRKE